MVAHLDTEFEKAVESHSDITLGRTTEHTGGGYVIYVKCNGESYSLNEERRVQHNGAKTIIDSNPNLSVTEILEMIQSHANAQ